MFIKLPYEKIRAQLGIFLYLLERHWLKGMLIGLACFMMVERNLTVELRLSTTHPSLSWGPVEPAVSGLQPVPQPSAEATFTASEGASRKQQQQYVQRFAKVAQAEMEKFGIPASIKLAQGLLESQAGISPLARDNNNHFGLKCFSSHCQKGHCSNFDDDTHKDFFRIYRSAWESYRAHSLLLHQSKRYQPLFNLPADDYRSWAKGLAKAGYATDPDYAKKLAVLIEALKLYRFDQV